MSIMISIIKYLISSSIVMSDLRSNFRGYLYFLNRSLLIISVFLPDRAICITRFFL